MVKGLSDAALAFVETLSRELKELRVGDKPYEAYLRDGGASGDEADVVDRLFVGGVLLPALGYSPELLVYNRQKGSERPDWQVHLDVGAPPYFLVESKSSGEDLRGHEGQLFRYMRRLGVPRGILTNGKEVLAYELRGDTPLPLLAFSVLDLWEPGLFPENLQSALRTLYYRFHRDHLLSLRTVIDDLTLTKSGNLHAPDGSTWPADARIQVVEAKGEGFAQRFAQDLGDLLKAVQEDARSQLTAWLREIEDLEAILWASPNGKKDLREEFEDLRKRFRSDLERSFPQQDFSWLSEELKAPWEGRAVPWRGAAERIFGRLRAQVGTRRGERGWDTKRSYLDELEKLATAYEERWLLLKERHRNALAVKEAFEAWRKRYGFLLEAIGEKVDLEGEYALQTAYVFLVRLLLVRIAEDKGLLERRMFTDGGVAEWLVRVEPYYLGRESAEGMAAFLGMVFGRAQRDVYAHFFSEGTFDWYRPNRDLALRLLWRLAHYDFRDVDQDIIGYLYAHYATKEHRHNTGMYYTPPEVVDYILDRVGFSGGVVAAKTLLDPACGSGTFLVRAARRILEAFKAPSGTIPEAKQEDALRAVLENLVGLDVNPFACYLAEINLLIQVVDLVKALKERGVEVHLDRFRVYNTDTLIARFPNLEWARGFPEEEVKLTPEAFDFVVGNPPYVRADAPGMKDYRELVRAHLPLKERVEEVLTQKWDLFVPFVALGLEWLREGGRLGMILSRSVEVAPYARKLRERLARYRLIEVSRMSGQALFPEAVVDNTVLVVEKASPPSGHAVLERWFSAGPAARPDEEKSVPLEEFLPRWIEGRGAPSPAIHTGKAVPLREICFVSAGMELHPHERHKGDYELKDILSKKKDDIHRKPIVTGEEVEPFYPKRVLWVEWGTDRVPEKVRRPRFAELWEKPKLLVQRTLSRFRIEAFWDRGEDWEPDRKGTAIYLLASDSVLVIVRWCDLAGVAARQLGAVDDPERKRREVLSRRFSLGYLVGVLNTKAAWDRFGFRQGREGRVSVEPEPLKALPIPLADEAEQRRISRLALALEGVERRLRRLEEEGWNLKTFTPPEALLRSQDQGLEVPLSTAEVAWGLRVVNPSAKMRDLKREERILKAGRVVVLEASDDTSARALEWFVWMERTGGFKGRKSWEDLTKEGFRVPRLPEEALKVIDRASVEVKRVKRLLGRKERLLAELEERVERLYA